MKFVILFAAVVIFDLSLAHAEACEDCAMNVLASTAAPAGYPLVNGIVRKVDLVSQKVSIKHDDIPNLSMPAMTMSFSVSTPGALSLLVKDDKVVFAADEIGGVLTAIWIEKR